MMRRLQLALMFLATSSLGVLTGSCTGPKWEIEMTTWCLPKEGLVITCREICETRGILCSESEECPAAAFGLDINQCEMELDLQGVVLDVGCDDPLPDHFGYSCCCKDQSYN